jgi:hypothetical protein
MAITGATKVTVGMVDHSAEPTKVSFHIPMLEDDNFADLFAPTTGAVDLCEIAIESLSDCNTTSTHSSITNNTDAGQAPATVTAQRETAIRFSYVDTVTGASGHFDVPGPKVALYPATGTDNIDLGNVTVAAAVLVFEANMCSPAGNPINITRATFVGRGN